MVNGTGSCGCRPGTHFQSSDSAFQRWICASTIMRRSTCAAAFCAPCVASVAPAAMVLVRKLRRDSMSSSSLWLEVLLASHLAPNAWPPQWHWHARARNRRALHVMAGLVPAIHVLRGRRSKTWMPATSAGMTSRKSCVLILLLRLREMAQVRRRLAFSHGHQQAVGAKVIDFLAD